MEKPKNSSSRKQTRRCSSYFVEDKGFSLERHCVITEDEYILCVERLQKNASPEVENLDEVEKRPVALLVHGLLSRGDHWCCIEPEIGLPQKLFEQGYDVWLPSLRGSSPSQGHSYLSTKTKSYWNFSFHELGIYDLPAIINYILDLTGNESLTYIGHSLGAAIFFVLLSEKPEYAVKIDVMIALAPAVFAEHVTNFVFRFYILLGNVIGTSPFLTKRPFGEAAGKSVKYIAFSKRDKVGAWFLKKLGESSGIFGKRGICNDRLRKLSSELPSPTSLKLVCHGFQNFKSNKARAYDYGRAGNMEVYGRLKPAQYNFANVRVPVIAFSSEGDELCRPKDVGTLVSKLPNVLSHCTVPDRNFGHGDFMLGKDAYSLVYKKMIEALTEMREFESEKILSSEIDTEVTIL